MARLVLGQRVIDQVILLFMKAPFSSTGEDVCEIHCHGSRAVIDVLLARLGAQEGFAMAQPGEFTRRSFMNGKMDLSGVEGLADLIEAETTIQLHQAWAQIDGYLRGPVARWREDLIALASQLEALIDFADEDLPQNVETTLRQQTALLISDIAAIMDDQRAGELVRDGVVLALVGPVNAGKSTILNGLAGRAAAIRTKRRPTTGWTPRMPPAPAPAPPADNPVAQPAPRARQRAALTSNPLRTRRAATVRGMWAWYRSVGRAHGDGVRDMSMWEGCKSAEQRS